VPGALRAELGLSVLATNLTVSITKFQTPRKGDSNIEVLVLIGVTVVLAIVIAIVVIMMVEFCVGLCCARCLRTYSRYEYLVATFGLACMGRNFKVLRLPGDNDLYQIRQPTAAPGKSSNVMKFYSRYLNTYQSPPVNRP